MKKMHIELDIEVEEYVEKLFGDSPESLKKELTERIHEWVDHYLESLETDDPEEESE